MGMGFPVGIRPVARNAVWRGFEALKAAPMGVGSAPETFLYFFL